MSLLHESCQTAASFDNTVECEEVMGGDDAGECGEGLICPRHSVEVRSGWASIATAAVHAKCHKAGEHTWQRQKGQSTAGAKGKTKQQTPNVNMENIELMLLANRALQH